MSSARDQFIDDDEEETCPLCVEELDLTDKGFRPCPCGYQICQFCYHNVKNNMNGLCPACRRPYSDKDIEYKLITPEETAAHKARQAQKQKKTQAALQKERQKQEADSLSRKHLAGLRVVQKNLVYVTGLAPSSQEDQLLATLRGDQYFGQYGKIIKIVVSKARDPSHPHSIGVYVTYERKDDAACCIAAVDGSKNGDRTLRAQFGTTKYCSAYLRGDTCTNRNCMFLHEPGEANDSYSRADLSALNARHSGANNPPPQSQQPVASAVPVLGSQASRDAASSPVPEGPALPSTASWASKPAQPSRAESRSTSATHGSPAVNNETPIMTEPEMAVQPETQAPEQAQHQTAPRQPKPRMARVDSPLLNLLKDFAIDDFRFAFSTESIPQADLDIIEGYPPLFDNNGGAKRRLRKQREEEVLRIQEELRQQQVQQQQQAMDQDENPEVSGSMQLGGEPEDKNGLGHSGTVHPPGIDGGLDQRFQFGGVTSPGISDHGTTPQHQQQQALLQTMKSPNAASTFLAQPHTVQGQSQGAPPGHQRNTSRYTFANETSSATTAVKPVANAKLMNQQSTMMPSSSSNHFGPQQSHGNQFYTSNVQGPPPGLKTTGTPPVSGGMTFGQGHGFATGGLQYGAGASSRNPNDELYQNLLRGRNSSAANAAADKREFSSNFPGNFNGTHGSTFAPHSTAAGFGPSSASSSGYASLSSFGDGEKRQKKKGKKHRHANTSSSSGGLDANDQSHMLQTRLHQSSGGAFGGGGGAAGGLYNSVMHGGVGGNYGGGRW